MSHVNKVTYQPTLLVVDLIHDLGIVFSVQGISPLVMGDTSMFFSSRSPLPYLAFLVLLGACTASNESNRPTAQTFSGPTNPGLQRVVSTERPVRVVGTLCGQPIEVPTAAHNVELLRGEWLDDGRPQGSRGLCTGAARYDIGNRSNLTYVWGQGRTFPPGQETVLAVPADDGSFNALLPNGVSLKYHPLRDGARQAEYNRNGQTVSRASMQPLRDGG